MIGRMTKKVRVLTILAVLMGMLPITSAYASCDGFTDGFETTSLGISYKKDPETGSIRAFLMSGEASFLAPKSSLVRKAKKKAFMMAKAEFTRFMKEDFVAADLTSDLLDPHSKNRERAELASDQIRKKFGGNAIIKGRSLR